MLPGPNSGLQGWKLHTFSSWTPLCCSVSVLSSWVSRSVGFFLPSSQVDQVSLFLISTLFQPPAQPSLPEWAVELDVATVSLQGGRKLEPGSVAGGSWLLLLSPAWLCWREVLGVQPGGNEQTEVETGAVGSCLSKKTGVLECSLSSCTCSGISPCDTSAGVTPVQGCSLNPNVGLPAHGAGAALCHKLCMTTSGPVLSLPLCRLGNKDISPWISLFLFVTGGTGRVTAMSESLCGAPSP